MKNLFGARIFLLAAIILTVGCGETELVKESEGYIVNGTIQGVKNTFAKLVVPNVTDWKNPTILDSVQVRDGKFKFKGKLDHVDRVDIRIDSSYFCSFFLENASIEIEMDINEADERSGHIIPSVTGSESNAEYKRQEAVRDSIFNQPKYAELDKAGKELRNAYKSKDENLIRAAKEAFTAYEKQEKDRYTEYQNSIYSYARQHPESPVAVYVLGFQFSEGRMSKTEMKEFYNLFTGSAKETALYKGYYTKTYKEVFERLGVGATAPDITLERVEGVEFTLSEAEGRFILVDFWASWCVPCRASFPHLMELYDKYHKDGFEVVGIGTADEEKKWRKAIEEDQTPWIHIYDVIKYEEGRRVPYGPVAKNYSVPFLPTTFLMDADLTILGRNMTKDELDAKLVELFGY